MKKQLDMDDFMRGYLELPPEEQRLILKIAQKIDPSDESCTVQLSQEELLDIFDDNESNEINAFLDFLNTEYGKRNVADTTVICTAAKEFGSKHKKLMKKLADS